MELRQEWNKTKTQKFQQSLLRWYAKHHRALPWRSNPTPYRVWISEVMLQQTQVKTVIPYYNRFLKRFPNIKSLAKAGESEVLALWAGLGYYSRAHSIHQAAGLILERHGEFPKEYEDILALPGIGRYTAGAICSLAFNQPRPVVDGNIQRVITRLEGITRRPHASYFWNQMSAWMPETKSSSFNQAMMELGATVCVPFQPLCQQCPVKRLCEARRLGIQDRIPGIRAKQAIKRIQIAILVLEQKGRILLSSVHKPDFIPGKWGIPCQQIMDESPEKAASALCRSIVGRTIPLLCYTRIHHSISRYRILAYAFCGKLDFYTLHAHSIGKYCWSSYLQSKTRLTSSLFRKVLQKYEALRLKVK